MKVFRRTIAAVVLMCSSSMVQANVELPSPVGQTIVSPFGGSFNYIPFMECGKYVGSGVRISDDMVITAKHVVDAAPCTIQGHQALVIYNAPGMDFSVVRVSDLGDGYRGLVSCDGIHEGQRYIAIGYAFGHYAALEHLIGTKDKATDGEVMMRGKIYHGQSGGALLDEQGSVVGIINAILEDQPIAFVTPLSNTYLCAAHDLAVR